jgi:hypothetical protein
VTRPLAAIDLRHKYSCPQLRGLQIGTAIIADRPRPNVSPRTPGNLCEIKHSPQGKQKSSRILCFLKELESLDSGDCEAIGLLGRRMFETSKATGKAGYQQWGLDAGNYQGKWIPYASEEWNLGDIAEAKEEEYEVR